MAVRQKKWRMPKSMPFDPRLGAVTAPLSATADPLLLLTCAIAAYSAVRLDRLCTAPMP